MPRFYLPPEAWTAAPALTGDEARHLSQVLRTKSGAIITIFDGQGRRASARVLQVSREHVTLEIGEIPPATVVKPAITLAQAIPKGKNMDLIVQKAVELGVSVIQPLVTANTIVQPGEGKSEKWRRVALEACKQCGQDTLPRIAEPLAFERWIPMAAGDASLKIFASLAPEAHNFKKILRAHGELEAVTLMVGPEGDFTSDETQSAIHQGFIPVTLGDIVLRVETASIFGMAAVRYEFAQPMLPY